MGSAQRRSPFEDPVKVFLGPLRKRRSICSLVALTSTQARSIGLTRPTCPGSAWSSSRVRQGEPRAAGAWHLHLSHGPGLRLRRFLTKYNEPTARHQRVGLEFLVRRRSGAGRGPCSERPSAHGLDRQGPPSVHWRRSAAYYPPTTNAGVPHCSKPGTRQVCVPDHGHSRTAPGREILGASSRPGARRTGVSRAHAAPS